MRILKLVFLFLPFLIMQACTSPKTEYLIYAGTYTGHGSDGIYAYRFNPDEGALTAIGLVAKTDNPSFIAIDSAGRFLYAVNELDSFQNKPEGAVSVFEIDKKSGQLKLCSRFPRLVLLRHICRLISRAGTVRQIITVEIQLYSLSEVMGNLDCVLLCYRIPDRV